MSLKFRVYKFLVFSEILVHSFKPLISDYTNNQVDDFGPRRSMENGCSVPTWIFWIFSGDFSGRFPRECTRKWSKVTRKKSEDFSAGILLPCSIDFRCFPAGTGPYFLTRVVSTMLSRLVMLKKNKHAVRS